MPLVGCPFPNPLCPSPSLLLTVTGEQFCSATCCPPWHSALSQPTVIGPAHMIQNLWNYKPKQNYCLFTCGLRDFVRVIEKWLINFRRRIWQKNIRNSCKKNQKTLKKQQCFRKFFSEKINREIEIIKKQEACCTSVVESLTCMRPWIWSPEPLIN